MPQARWLLAGGGGSTAWNGLSWFSPSAPLAAEAVNTAVETLADAVKPERHPLVGRAKDLAAAGVLLAAMAAATVGLLVFGPRVWALLYCLELP